MQSREKKKWARIEASNPSRALPKIRQFFRARGAFGLEIVRRQTLSAAMPFSTGLLSHEWPIECRIFSSSFFFGAPFRVSSQLYRIVYW